MRQNVQTRPLQTVQDCVLLGGGAELLQTSRGSSIGAEVGKAWMEGVTMSPEGAQDREEFQEGRGISQIFLRRDQALGVRKERVLEPLRVSKILRGPCACPVTLLHLARPQVSSEAILWQGRNQLVRRKRQGGGNRGSRSAPSVQGQGRGAGGVNSCEPRS